MQLDVTADEYRHAAALLWGEAGEYIVTTYQRLNRDHFDGELPAVPMVIGLAAYGRCLGLTRPGGTWTARTPRITIASNLFQQGRERVADTVLHEMLHVKAIIAGLDPAHNAEPWCAEITRMSPAVLGRHVQAAPVNPRRVPNPAHGRIDGAPKTLVRRVPRDGHLTRAELAGWPNSLRGPDWDPGEPLDVDTY